MFGRVVAASTAVLMVPSLPKPAVNDLCEVVFEMNAQVLHSVRAPVRVCGPIGVVATLAGSFMGYPGQLSVPIL